MFFGTSGIGQQLTFSVVPAGRCPDVTWNGNASRVLYELLVDLLWFGVLGYHSVFLTELGAQVAIFAAVWIVAFVAICVSGLIALRLIQRRERLRILRRSENSRARR
jgi:uncharacterized membrane protein (UPF0182 family)